MQLETPCHKYDFFRIPEGNNQGNGPTIQLAAYTFLLKTAIGKEEFNELTDIMAATYVYLFFHGNLIRLLPKGKRERSLSYRLDRRASIKDIIESLGIPHTEIGRLLRGDGRELDFSHIGTAGEEVHVHPFTSTTPWQRPTLLRPQPLSRLAFMVDDTVTRLGRNLRMVGLDTTDAPASRDEIACEASSQERVVVSRNRELLKSRAIVFGQLILSLHHEEQLHEVLARFAGSVRLHPFSRCLLCNQLLEKVDKRVIFHRLLPLTRKYYTDFKQCPGCGKIYWYGSHMQRMEHIVAEARKLHSD